eukprot:Phypoly_transcript_23677.p1 GENE.Phypoly_transcript_23677~~Phypoly_transcript_23677.p1  ORF type:complete len:137 (+),score=11.90 Phypoly_transcript_23677:87-497(+)
MKGTTLLAFAFIISIGVAFAQSSESDSDCSASISLTARSGATWTVQGKLNQIYDISIKNTGSVPINSIGFNFALGGNSAIREYWGLLGGGGNTYYSSNASGVPVGQYFPTAGFILTGFASISSSLTVSTTYETSDC